VQSPICREETSGILLESHFAVATGYGHIRDRLRLRFQEYSSNVVECLDGKKSRDNCDDPGGSNLGVAEPVPLVWPHEKIRNSWQMKNGVETPDETP